MTYKVALKPGHSLMDWIRFSKSGKDLTGLRGRLIEVTEEELQKHNKRDDCWTCIRGEPGRSVQMSTWCQARWHFTPPLVLNAVELRCSEYISKDIILLLLLLLLLQVAVFQMKAYDYFIAKYDGSMLYIMLSDNPWKQNLTCNCSPLVSRYGL